MIHRQETSCISVTFHRTLDVFLLSLLQCALSSLAYSLVTMKCYSRPLCFGELGLLRPGHPVLLLHPHLKRSCYLKLKWILPFPTLKPRVCRSDSLTLTIQEPPDLIHDSPDQHLDYGRLAPSVGGMTYSQVNSWKLLSKGKETGIIIHETECVVLGLSLLLPRTNVQ